MNEYENYLCYLRSFLDAEHSIEKESPFLYEEWVMCGQPDSYIPGVRFEDNSYLVLVLHDKDGNPQGYNYALLDERMATTIAEGIASGRFKGPARREESTVADA